MPPIRKLRARPRSELRRTTCPTRRPRSRASLLPIRMPSAGRLLLPSTTAASMSAISESLPGITPMTPTGATACPRSTKADPRICGDTAVTPGVFSMIGMSGCQIAICSRRLRSFCSATCARLSAERMAGSRSGISRTIWGILPTVLRVSRVASPPMSALMKMKTLTPSATPAISSEVCPG